VGWNPTDTEFEEEGARVEAAFEKYFYRLTSDDKHSIHSSDNDTTLTSTTNTNTDTIPSQTTVLVCHGNVTRYLSLRALQLPAFAWLRLAVYNGSITILEIRPSGNVSIRSLGDVGHLPPDLITYSLKN